MPSKHKCNNCCKNGCEETMPSDLRCCCSSICDAICVTIKLDGCPDDCEEAQAGCDDNCDCHCASAEFSWNCLTESYAGSISCGSMSIDLEFDFKQCDDGKCYMCLTSSCLGKYGECGEGDYGDCKSFTPGKYQCRGTIDGIVRTGGLSHSWGVDLSDCGNAYCGAATINVECAERILPSKPNGCNDPLCFGCDCACRCVCITYTDDACSKTVRTCWSDYINGWTASIVCPYETVDITITLGPNEYTGECELSMTSSVGDGDPVALACPEVSATWEVTKDDTTTATINVSCSTCGECNLTDFLCCGRFLPKTLTATLSNVTNCACFDGLAVTLEYVPADFLWRGEIDSCDAAQVDPSDPTLGPGVMIVEVECVGEALCSDLVLTISGCSGDTGAADPGCSCDPLFVEYKNLNIDACCTIGIEGQPNRIDVTLTE